MKRFFRLISVIGVLVSLQACEHEENPYVRDVFVRLGDVNAKVLPTGVTMEAYILFPEHSVNSYYRWGFEVSKNGDMSSPDEISASVRYFDGTYDLMYTDFNPLDWEDGEIIYYRAFCSRKEGETPVYSEVKSIKYVKYIINFQDAAFKAYCIKNFDTDGDGGISMAEAKDVTEIDCTGKGIKSLAGIEYFTSLKWLYCEGNKLVTLDLRGNKDLKTVDCEDNQLTSIDISGNTKLLYLYCSNNSLASLDVSHNVSLMYLFCMYNKLSNLDVSKNINLLILETKDNNLTSLDVSKNSLLTGLGFSYNKLTRINLRNNTNLREFYCVSNNISELDLTANGKLEFINCGNNQLSYLNVSKNPNLTDLDFDTNQISSIDISNQSKLHDLRCFSNNLSSLDVSHNPNIDTLYCSSNKLRSLDVSNLSGLNDLRCTNNPNLTEIWLKKGQVINTFYYDTNVATIKYKNNESSTSFVFIPSGVPAGGSSPEQGGGNSDRRIGETSCRDIGDIARHRVQHPHRP